jgi:hypothetical protein
MDVLRQQLETSSSRQAPGPEDGVSNGNQITSSKINNQNANEKRLRITVSDSQWSRLRLLSDADTTDHVPSFSPPRHLVLLIPTEVLLDLS